MFTDMVNYTALSQTDEALALEILEEQRKIVRPIISKHNGNEIKTIGDAFLVEFRSALQAVNCAYEIQSSLREQNLARELGRHINLRIGVHLGDVVHSGGDVYGDAVNVASRIVSTAEPGGICLSSQVYDQVKNKASFPFLKLGDKYLKNVQGALEVYRVVLPWEQKKASLPMQQGIAMDRNRIAVLPFASMSPDLTDEYFADGMTEELITALSSIKGLDIIARTTAMQYRGAAKRISEIGRELGSDSVIEGSVRKSGNRVRITVQLVNAQNESHLWAQNYDKQLDDIFAVQSDIAKRVARTLKGRLLTKENRELEKPAAKNAEAYMLYLKGRYHWNKRTKENVLEAISYLKSAIEKDPSFALGYSGLADCYLVLAANDEDEEARAPNFEKAENFARKALELDSGLGEAHATLGGIVFRRDFDFEQGEKEFKKAIDLKPSYATAHQWYGLMLQVLGRMDEAESEIRRAQDLDPLSLIVNQNLAEILTEKGEYANAIELYRKLLIQVPDFPDAHASLGRAYCLAHMYDEALREVEIVEKLNRDRSTATLYRAYVYAHMGRAEEARSLLESAGAHGDAHPFLAAMICFVLKDKEKGFEYLEKGAEKEHRQELLGMKIARELDEVREDPRYHVLLKKVNLE
jgi:adenylate cyclase